MKINWESINKTVARKSVLKETPTVKLRWLVTTDDMHLQQKWLVEYYDGEGCRRVKDEWRTVEVTEESGTP